MKASVGNFHLSASNISYSLSNYQVQFSVRTLNHVILAPPFLPSRHFTYFTLSLSVIAGLFVSLTSNTSFSVSYSNPLQINFLSGLCSNNPNCFL